MCKKKKREVNCTDEEEEDDTGSVCEASEIDPEDAYSEMGLE